MTLYEIDKNIKAVIEDGFVADEDGVITFEAGDLDNLQAQLEDKLENIALYIKNLKADITALKDEETMLKARRATKENKVQWLEQYITSYLKQNNMKNLDTPRVYASIRQSEAVVVDEVDKLPAEYVTIKTEAKPDKKAIKQALKAGIEIEGAKLVQNDNLNIK